MTIKLSTHTHSRRFPRTSKTSHYIIKDNIDEKPVPKDEMKDGTLYTVTVHVWQQAHIEYSHHRGRQEDHQGHEYLKYKYMEKVNIFLENTKLIFHNRDIIDSLV